MIGWSIDYWLLEWLIDWLIIDWLVGWLIDYLIDWLIDWLLIDWETVVCLYVQCVMLCLQKHKLDAVYYYMRSLSATNPFLSAREGLNQLFDEARKKVSLIVPHKKEDKFMDLPSKLFNADL